MIKNEVLNLKRYFAVDCKIRVSLKKKYLTIFFKKNQNGKILIRGKDVDILRLNGSPDKYLVLDVKVLTGEVPPELIVEFLSAPENDEEIKSKPGLSIELFYRILPNTRIPVSFGLNSLDSYSKFLPPIVGGFKGLINGKPIDIKKIFQFSIGLGNVKEDLEYIIY